MDKPERHRQSNTVIRGEPSMSGIVYDNEGRYTEQMLEYDKQLSASIHIIVEGMYNYVSHNGGTPQDLQHLKAVAIETLFEAMSGGYATKPTE